MEPEWRNPDGTVNYQEYIASPEWRRFREGYWQRHPRGCCERCGRDNSSHVTRFGVRLHLHHRTYKTLGQETDDDVEAVCKPCHDKEHGGTQNSAPGAAFILADDPNWEVGALARIAERRIALGKKFAHDHDRLWKELGKLQWLEDFVRASKRMKQPDVADWISVSDAQPAPGETVWCAIPGEEEQWSIKRALFEDYVFWSGDSLLKNVTHWSRQEKNTAPSARSGEGASHEIQSR